MKIFAASINWNLDCANDPDFIVTLESHVKHSFTRIPSPNGVYYFSEVNGLATFHFSNSDKHGYGGRVFDLPMSDGSVAHVKGPWHVGPYWLNSQRPPHLELIPITTTYPNDTMRFFGLCITLEKLKAEVLPLLPNVALARVTLYKRNYIIPVLINRDHECRSHEPKDPFAVCEICKHKMYSNIVLI